MSAACDVFDCGMPTAGVVFAGMNPDPFTESLKLCESHLRVDIDRRIALRLPFAVAPWAVIAGRMAA